MAKVKKYIKIIIGCLVISLGLNIFLRPSKLIASGALGFASLLSYDYNFNVVAILLILNVWVLWLVYMIYNKEKLNDYLIPSLLVPFFIFLTSFIKIDLTDSVEELLLAIFGAIVTGYGYSFLYKEGLKVGAINILEDIFNDINNKNTRLISRTFDIFLVLFIIVSTSLEQALYSIIVIVVIRYMTTKARLGISDYKAFYIITSKEKEVKRFIMEDLKYDMTLFDVEGGFSKKKNKIVLTVVPTKDYFRLKEGIKLIDDKAFISITDNYEVLNKDLDVPQDK